MHLHILFAFSQVIICLAVAAKLKCKTRLTDVPFAVTEAELLAELGYRTKVLVNLDNDNYENSSVVKIDGKTMRGYQLGVLRGILDDSGIAEEIVFGTLKTPDMEQCGEMLKNTPCFHEDDIRIHDRGFSW